ncbi:hypothetical protein CU669_05110 [Paramagnetospirillum kuznetsovii]|uniref:Suppressor protein SRP40 n=1 Tax=Paramagnetospirillum kuznetsovii TaxID=2053833 RepID=A0A364P0A7_9PROT|nr:hypothetical protein [Paramagnetospirillum kuznetsovii]RAU22771.1 hypothetical protein CU669_05110 [Paramagnetospirillum kuznetsovii]
MSVNALGQRQSPQAMMLSNLESNGLSADKANAISKEIDSVVKATMSSSASDSAKASPSDVRAAIEAKLKEDIESGEITEEDATTIRTTLDQFESQMAKGHGGGPPPGPPPGGGADSQSASSDSKTVKSTTSTTTNGITTTVTTYSDGSTSSSVSFDTSGQSSIQTLQDLLKALSGDNAANSSNYLSKMLSSGLVDTSA